jgi:hypothetical protein
VPMTRLRKCFGRLPGLASSVNMPSRASQTTAAVAVAACNYARRSPSPFDLR